jgi:hypothetical protein
MLPPAPLVRPTTLMGLFKPGAALPPNPASGAPCAAPSSVGRRTSSSVHPRATPASPVVVFHTSARVLPQPASHDVRPEVHQLPTISHAAKTLRASPVPRTDRARHHLAPPREAQAWFDRLRRRRVPTRALAAGHVAAAMPWGMRSRSPSPDWDFITRYEATVTVHLPGSGGYNLF